jgi:hypothetical protein
MAALPSYASDSVATQGCTDRVKVAQHLSSEHRGFVAV